MTHPTFPTLLSSPITRARLWEKYLPGFFTWGIYGGMVLAAAACIVLYGRNIPLAEDWTLIAPFTGREPDFWAWVWSQNNEHRVPLPRLMMLGLLGLSGGDFRSGMVVNVVLMSALTLAMLLAVRSMRGGRTSAVDAIFPLLLLHIGNWENLFWNWQLSFVVAIVLYSVVMLVFLLNKDLTKPGTAIFLAVSLVLFPLMGAVGLVFVPLLALFLGYLGWRALRFSGKHWVGYMLIGSAAAGLVLMGVYFIGYIKPWWNPPSPGIGASLSTAVKFLALGFGPIAKMNWAIFGAAAFAFMIPTALLILYAAWKNTGQEKLRAIGLLVFCGCLVLLVLAMGWGRSGLMPTVGLPNRYVLLSAPIFCAAFFIWQLYGPLPLRRAFQWALLIACLLSFPINTRAGLMIRDWYVDGMKSVEQNIQDGLSFEGIAANNRDFLVHWWDEDMLIDKMRLLKEAGIGPFVHVREANGTFERDPAADDSSYSPPFHSLENGFITERFLFQ
jgi:hypothetical protein